MDLPIKHGDFPISYLSFSDRKSPKTAVAYPSETSDSDDPPAWRPGPGKEQAWRSMSKTHEDHP